MAVITVPEKTIERLASKVDEAGLESSMSYSLADAIREGSSVTDQAFDWQQGDNLCALSAATLAVKARHLV